MAAQDRLDRLVAARQGDGELYLLPDPRTLLCPARLRRRIEDEPDAGRRLTLFCLYQASHNHDSQRLYPFRIPASEGLLAALRADLQGTVCGAMCMGTSAPLRRPSRQPSAPTDSSPPRT